MDVKTIFIMIALQILTAAILVAYDLVLLHKWQWYISHNNMDAAIKARSVSDTMFGIFINTRQLREYTLLHAYVLLYRDTALRGEVTRGGMRNNKYAAVWDELRTGRPGDMLNSVVGLARRAEDFDMDLVGAAQALVLTHRLYSLAYAGVHGDRYSAKAREAADDIAKRVLDVSRLLNRGERVVMAVERYYEEAIEETYPEIKGVQNV